MKYRQLTFAASGSVREEDYNGRKHLVVPVVALVEGVIQAMNSETPEFVSAEEFSKFPSAWNGRPVFYDHPLVDGVPVSGNSPDLLEEKSIGIVFNSVVRKGKLTMEAWIDVEKAEKVAPEILERIAAGDPIEISVGLYTDTDEDESGEYLGKKYKGAWHDLKPDHLALLSKGHTGACSRKMGCGVRAAEFRSLVIREEKGRYCLYTHDGKKKLGCHDTREKAEAQERAIKSAEGVTMISRFFSKVLSTFRGTQSPDEMTYNDLMRKLSEALRGMEPNLNYVQDYYPVVDPERVVFSVYEQQGQGYKHCLYERQFSLSDSGVVSLSDPRVRVEPVVTYEPVEEEETEPYVATESTKTAKGTEGSSCSCGEQPKAGQASTGEENMDKATLIKALENATPETIKTLADALQGSNPVVKAAQDAQAKAEADLKAAQDKAAADVKAAQDKAAADVKAAQEAPEFVAFKAAAEAKRVATIKALKDTGRCELSDEALGRMTQAELDSLVKLAGGNKTVDFSGQAPRDAQAPAQAPEAPSLIDAVKAARGK